MLKDITIGQHFPGDSIVHRTDPRLKILLVIAYIVLLFTINNFLGLALSLVLLAGLYMLAKIPLRIIVKSLKPIIPIIAFTAILNLFFMGGEGEPLIHFWVIKVYKEGIAYAIFMAVRIVALIAGTGLLTYTTSPIVLTDAIERLLSPFAKLGLPVHELAMMMTIALRFIPTLIEETDKIMNAQKARGAMLLALGLSVPQVTKIFLKLRQMGLDLPQDVYTVPWAVKTILEAKARKEAKGEETTC